MNDRERAPSWTDGVAGLLGAAVALAVIEVLSLFDATGATATEAIENRFIGDFAAGLKDLAIELFGRNDKVALQIGTAVVTLAIGAFLGSRAAGRSRWIVGGFAAFAVLGIVVSFGDPQASAGLAVVSCLLGAAAGAATTLGLQHRWSSAPRPTLAPPAAASDEPMPVGALSRRQVLIDTGVMAGLLVVGVELSRAARGSARHAVTRVKTALPRPKRSVAVPTETLDRGAKAIEGVSPYVTPTGDFYRIDTAVTVPAVDVDSWTFTIKGMVRRELTFTYSDLLARDLVEVPITMQCVSNEVGGDLIGTARWLGVPFKELLEEAGVRSGAEQVMGESVDGFTAGFPVGVALDGRDAILAVGMNGRPLPAEHGFPARLVIPGLYGYVSATKWIKEVRVTTWDAEEGFWVPRGWSRLGPIKTSSRIDVPRSGDSVARGVQAVAGVAWAPHRGIERVEVQVDDGPWERASLSTAASSDTWVQWWWRWDAPKGDHTLRVRAVDGKGRTQTSAEAPPDPDGATGLHTIDVTVS